MARKELGIVDMVWCVLKYKTKRVSYGILVKVYPRSYVLSTTTILHQLRMDCNIFQHSLTSMDRSAVVWDDSNQILKADSYPCQFHYHLLQK